MYRRYTQVNESGVSMAQIKRSRIKDLIILLLLLALAASLVIGIPAYLKQGTLREEYIRQIRKECSDAIDRTVALSRTDGSDYKPNLAKVRSNLYAMRSINTLYSELNGQPLVSADQLQTLINTVDGYMSDLNTGLNTGLNQTNLQNGLEELQAILIDLE